MEGLLNKPALFAGRGEFVNKASVFSQASLLSRRASDHLGTILALGLQPQGSAEAIPAPGQNKNPGVQHCDSFVTPEGMAGGVPAWKSGE